MKADDIRELSVDDMRARVAELEEERFRLKFRSATETLEDPLRLRSIRRDIARIYTIIGQTERGESVPTSGTATKKTTARKGAGKTATKSAAKGATKKTATKTATKKTAGTTAAKSATKKTATKKSATKSASKSAAKATSKTASKKASSETAS